MVSKQRLMELADEPIRSGERASKIWLPQGKTPSTKLTDEERAANRANASMARANKKAADSEKRAKLLAYYATTEVPVERVAEHLGIEVGEARKSLEALRK